MTIKRNHVVMVAAALLLVVAGGLVWWWWHRVPSDVLIASGTIETTEVSVSFKVPGRVIERAVDEGDRVEVRALVARLESAELVAEVDGRRAAVEASQSRVPQLETEVAWREELRRRNVEQTEATLLARRERLAELRAGPRPQEVAEAEATLVSRQARLAELRAGSRPQELQQAEAEVEEARAVLKNAQTDFQRLDVLFRAGAATGQSRDAAEAAFEVARERLRHALERLALVREGPRPEEIRRADADVQQARARLALVREGPRAEEIRRAAAEVREAEAVLHRARAGELEVALTRQRLATLRADLDRDRAALAAAEARVGYTTLHSPHAGVVVRKHVEPGEMIAAATPVVTLADLRNVWLRIYVPTPQLGRIKLGQTADVTTDSYPGKRYRGTVTFVSAEAEFTPRHVQTPEERVKLVFAVKITIDNPAQELKPGMPADAVVYLR
jgi:HlyD family secretion protein